jgi:hypothetical protein
MAGFWILRNEVVVGLPYTMFENHVFIVFLFFQFMGL